jgi:hypothetical protein
MQVDAYRNVGKEEAAARLEDQLTLIHTKFQVFCPALLTSDDKVTLKRTSSKYFFEPTCQSRHLQILFTAIL